MIPVYRASGAALFLLIAAGCSASGSGGRAGAELSGANPASVFCAEQGGRLEIRDEAGGQAGYCTLPDGNVIEEWQLYRERSDL